MVEYIKRDAIPEGWKLYEVGGKFTDDLPPGQPEGTAVKLMEGAGMHILYTLKSPSPVEVNAFRRGNVSFGLVTAPVFPWGIFLVGWQMSNGQVMTQEMPMAIQSEAAARPEGVRQFLDLEANACYMTMVDLDTMTIVGIRVVALPNKFYPKLAAVWKNQVEQGCDDATYYREYDKLCARYSTNHLWNRAERFLMDPPKKGSI